MELASTSRDDRATVEKVRTHLATQARRVSLFQALSLLGEEVPKPRAARKVQIRHVPHLHHPSGDLESVVEQNGDVILNSFVLGLLSASGPMPHRLVEEAIWQQRQDRISPLAHLLSLLGERHLFWFYRAWLLGRPEHGAEGNGTVQRSASSLCGSRSCNSNDIGVLGLFLNGPRSSAALTSLIAAFTGCKTRLEQFTGEWLGIQSEDRNTLGESVIGENTTIGDHVWQRNTSFKVHLEVRSYEEYLDLIPHRGACAKRLDELIARFLTIGWKWRYALILKSEQIVSAQIGEAGVLGETAWVDRPATPTDTIVFSSPSSRLASQRTPAAPGPTSTSGNLNHRTQHRHGHSR